MGARLMAATLRENLLEAIVGLVVLAVAIWFVWYAYDRTSGGLGGETYELTARFPNASGVAEGTDVRVSGLKVGSVTASRLDPESYQALVTLSVDDGVRLPLDSSAAITSEGILGGSYVALLPGGDTEYLEPGDEIIDTQGATDLLGLIGSVVNQTTGEPAPAPAPSPAAPAPAPAEGAPPPMETTP